MNIIKIKSQEIISRNKLGRRSWSVNWTDSTIIPCSSSRGIQFFFPLIMRNKNGQFAVVFSCGLGRRGEKLIKSTPMGALSTRTATVDPWVVFAVRLSWNLNDHYVFPYTFIHTWVIFHQLRCHTSFDLNIEIIT